MKKILLILLLTIFFIPNVNADGYEEYNTCFDEYKIADSLTFTTASNYHQQMLVNLPLSAYDTTKYYLKFWNLDSSHLYQVGSQHYFYDENDVVLAKNDYKYVSVSQISNTGVLTYSANSSTSALENVSYFHLSFYVYSSNNYYTPNRSVVLTLSDHELTECPTIEQPEEPDEPVIPDATLDTFYSIYIDKLVSLSNFATENKFVLSAITIVIFVCCLELFLYLVNRRRR